MAVIHQKIQELRNKIGYTPLQKFYPTKSISEVRSAKVENERLIKQYFCIFGIPDDYGTVPVKGCFKKSIEERGPKSNASDKIKVLWQHRPEDPLCNPTVLIEDEIGLYAEYEPDPVPSGDRCVIQTRSGTINNGSYGFGYIWDRMEYDDKTDLILMHEVKLNEISPVTFASQPQTYVVRSKDGFLIDEFLEDETEDLIKQLPRARQLEVRSIIDRHISLAKLSPSDKAPEPSKPKHVGLDYNYLISKM